MNANKTMKLPADCTRMTEEEMMYTNGGAAAETALKAGHRSGLGRRPAGGGQHGGPGRS